MTWRRGEQWFDADMLWFGERSPVPAFAGAAPVPVSRGLPPGLIASRQRRAEWKRRRYARRARATAIALSPAVVLALAGMRSAADPETALADDPPSLTFRLDKGTVRVVDQPKHVPRESEPMRAIPGVPPPIRSMSDRRPERAPAAVPKIHWREARSVGSPSAGYLVAGTQLPLYGPNWVTWNPVEDHVPNEPERLYGNEHTIRKILSVAKGYRLAHPDAPPIVVGDISRQGGGPMTDEHVSHQNGLDVDIYYPRLDGELTAPTTHDQIDFRLAQALLDRFVAAGAQMVFVGYSTGLRGPAGVVIPYAYHENHMHVRFPPPGG
jgi:hypothetical protein